MKTSELDMMQFRDSGHVHECRRIGGGHGAWKTYGRVLAWCRSMGVFRKYGEWTVQETCGSAACRGTVRARLSGPKGTVEAWNNMEVVFVPRGAKLSKAPYPVHLVEDERNGIRRWTELGFDESAYEGRSKYGQYAKAARDHFAECVAEACAMAGIGR